MIDILLNFFRVMYFVIFLSIIFSFFPNSRGHPFVRFIRSMTQPIYNIFRKIIPPVGMFDFSPLIAILLIRFIQMILESIKLEMVG
jgi:YggT family protein